MDRLSNTSERAIPGLESACFRLSKGDQQHLFKVHLHLIYSWHVNLSVHVNKGNPVYPIILRSPSVNLLGTRVITRNRSTQNKSVYERNIRWETFSFTHRWVRNGSTQNNHARNPTPKWNLWWHPFEFPRKNVRIEPKNCTKMELGKKRWNSITNCSIFLTTEHLIPTIWALKKEVRN